MIRRILAFTALFAIGTVDAQAAQQRPYPSLAKRPAESNDRFAETPPPAAEVAPAPTPADSALVAQVDGLARKASEADSAFQSQLAAGRKAATAAKGTAVSSEKWVAAQMAISGLDSARYESIASLASLDTLHVERVNGEDAARAASDIATIDPARTRVLALVDAQNDALDGLKTSLATP